MTLDEAKELRDGDVVDVTWSGGNGLHRYVVRWEGVDGTRLSAYMERDPKYCVGELFSKHDKVLINEIAKVSA